MNSRGVLIALALSCAVTMGAWAKSPVWSGGELDQMLGPIALYPDPLLAQVLAAATMPGDVAPAVKYLEDGGDLEGVDGQPWNDNAKALARYPEVLRMLHRNAEWANAVGAAFLDQTKDVMQSVQRLRAAAYYSGALRTCNEQRVVAEKGLISIYPGEPTAMHLPQYDPDQVFSVRTSSGGQGLVVFGSVLLVGYWLHHELDWRKRCLFSYDYREYPFGRRNAWYGGERGTGEVPPGLPKQDTGRWKPDRKKPRAHARPGGPLPKFVQPGTAAEPTAADEPEKPATESRPLAPPKDLPPPPPTLVPVDPEPDLLEVAPPAPADKNTKKAKKPAAVKPAPATTKPAAASAAKPKTAPAGTDKTKTVPASAGKSKPAAKSTAPAGKEKPKSAAQPAPAASGKAKSTQKATPAPAKAGQTKPAPAKTTPKKQS